MREAASITQERLVIVDFLADARRPALVWRRAIDNGNVM